MTNEQLAVLIQHGHNEYIAQLWQQVERFVAWQARKFCGRRDSIGGSTEEDFRQSGFLAMLDAVKYFDAEKGALFLTYLGYTLKNAFQRTADWHPQRSFANGLLDVSISLDHAVMVGGEDGDDLKDFIADPVAEDLLCAIDEYDAWEKLREAIETALKALPDDQVHAIKNCYYYNRPYNQKSRDAALKALRHPRISKGLRQYLTA